jgi:cell division initiation protein
MPLTPIDVQQKTFGTALRGYDLDEVDDFLDEVVTSLKDYEQRLRDAQERIATLEIEVTDRGDAEGAIARALVAAQRSADSIMTTATRSPSRMTMTSMMTRTMTRTRTQTRSSAVR